MKCRKCGAKNAEGVWVCTRCDYILDTSFLGSDILNERTRDGIDDDEPPPDVVDPPELPFHDFGDALILGRLGDEPVEPIVTDRSGGFMPGSDDQKKAPRSVYVTGEISRLVLPGRVLRHTSDADGRRDVLSPFELAVFDLIDARRTLAEVQEMASLSDNDLCIAVAMLVDKALVEAAPVVVDDETGRLVPDVEDDLAELDDATNELHELPPLASPPFDGVALPRAQGELNVDSGDVLEMRPQTTPSAKAPPLPAAKQPPPRAPATPAKAPPPKPGAPAKAVPPLPGQGARPAAPPVHDGVDDDEGAATAPERVPAGARPQMRPAMAPRPGMTKPATPAPARTSAPVAAPKTAAHDEGKKRAAGYYDLCMKDLAAGRTARAWGYAKMAADADPGDDKYVQLVRDWHRLHAGSHGEKASTPQELMASANEAEQQGNIERAVDLLRKLVERAPGSAGAWNKLAVLLATRQRDFKGAYDAAIKAVEIEPSNMAYQSNMMKILARVDAAESKRGEPADSKGLLGRLLRR